MQVTSDVTLAFDYLGRNLSFAVVFIQLIRFKQREKDRKAQGIQEHLWANGRHTVHHTFIILLRLGKMLNNKVKSWVCQSV